MTLFFGDLIPYLSHLFQGLWMSIYLTLIGMTVGSAIGIVIYLAKASPSKILRTVSSAYIEIFRNTPLLVQLYIIYFGLGQLGINLNPLWSAIIGITINNGAYTAEIFRAGIRSVPGGLKEAGRALGMGPVQIFRHIVLPPAVRNVFPALTNQLILLFLFSSTASIISFHDLMFEILYIDSQTFRTFEVLTVGGILYYACSSLFAAVSKMLEKKLFRW